MPLGLIVHQHRPSDNNKTCIKGVDMIRAEIGLKNRQIINETYSFCRFHTLHTRVPTQKLNEICVYVY
jgi:hypothetical protein